VTEAGPDDAVRLEAQRLLAALHVCTVATYGDGQPHAVSLFYAHDGFDLYWFSDPASRHSRHIDAMAEARVAVTIAADHQDFGDIRGIQLIGVARRLAGPLETAAGLARLVGRYGFLARVLEGPVRLAEAMRKAAIYRLTPDQVTFIDNSKGFGHKTSFRP
jgi:uncharacterized protein YhbP (UPF0306 family)